MTHLRTAIIVIIVLLAACVLSIIPPSEKLRRGRDLAGGVSLIYTVDTPAGGVGASGADLLAATIEVLKERVDPNGLYEISFTPLGQNRIEITMPLPTDEVKRLRAAYDAKLKELGAMAVTPADLDRILRSAPEERARAIEEAARGDASRRETLEKAAAAYDASVAADAAFAEAEAAGQAEADLLPLIDAAGEARQALAQAREGALQGTVDPIALAVALELPDEEKSVVERETGERVSLGSPRQKALDRIRAPAPAAAGKIDEVLAAHAQYAAKRRGLDDPNDLIRLLLGAGVLDFRIAVEPADPVDLAGLREQLQERGPMGTTDPQARWFPVHDISTWYDNDAGSLRALQADPAGFFAQRDLVGAERDGVYYILCYDTPTERILGRDGDWGLEQAYPTTDENGLPAIGFRMDPRGGARLGKLTGSHQQKPMAVLLDDRVYTAPNLLAKITRSGIIQGRFTSEDINYVRKVLNAGSLQARLSERPISQQTLAPSMGVDNLRSGLVAGVMAMLIISGFMIVYYWGAGMVAVFALACNAIMILGVMSLTRAAFTLPGIAGVILTFGMAVDSNVLIYERIREELRRGEDLRTAVRLGFQKVASAIIDANVTTLIVCVVLYYTATQEIRGFAITMGIGVLSTLVCALLVTRAIFAVLVDKIRVRRMSQLPLAFPWIERFLTPRINWLRLRPVFLVVSALYVGLGLAMIFSQGERMFDTEFRAGTAVTVDLAESKTATRGRIEEIVHGIGGAAGADSPLTPLRTATVLVVDPAADGVTSDRFTIKTTATDQQAVTDAIVSSMAGLLSVQPPLSFGGSDAPGLAGAPVFRVLDSSLGANIARPEVKDDVAEFVGGVAVVLENLSPAPTLADLDRRLAQKRESAEFANLLRHTTRVVILDGTPAEVRSAVVLASNPEISVLTHEDLWTRAVAGPEWGLARAALTTTSALASAQSFDAAIAQTFKAKAVVAILLSFLGVTIYLWVRFGSLWYASAALLALVHDTLVVVGLLAVTEVLQDHAPGLMRALGLQPFKIDLALVAAILTIIGYSLNDTIVIMDRVRENRGKLAYASAEVVNDSINQTFSRTVITAGTTLLASLILYIWGGPGIRSFSFAMVCGVIVGCYSTVAIAAPLLYSKKAAGGSRGTRGGQRAVPERALAPA